MDEHLEQFMEDPLSNARFATVEPASIPTPVTLVPSKCLAGGVQSRTELSLEII